MSSFRTVSIHVSGISTEGGFQTKKNLPNDCVPFSFREGGNVHPFSETSGKHVFLKRDKVL